MLRDKHTGKHKGFAYVEMADLEDVPGCLEVNECVPDFQNFAILVRPSEAEKNYNATGGAGTLPGATVASSKPVDPSRLFVANIHPAIDQQSLQEIMAFYGQIDSLKYISEPNKGSFAFVHFSTPEAAQAAIASLNGFPFGDKKLVVEQQR